MIDIKEKDLALKEFLELHAGDKSWISIEGYERINEFGSFEEAIVEPTDILPRQTRWPKLAFYILPLTSDSSERIFNLIESKELLHYPEGIIHLQIEKDGNRVFVGCDNLDPGSTWAIDLTAPYLESLIEKGIINGFEQSST